MKTKTLPSVIAISALLFALSAQAHDPKEHMQSAEQPDCTAMKDMDQTKMDMNDPVTQAMMQKCMKGMQGMKGMSSMKGMSGMKGMSDGDESTQDTGHEGGESEGHTDDDGSTDNHH
tara:strand:+ start:2935 stop:3285 length:351 start_codon:yes stop_codon:yes gene_type:complete